MMAFGLSFICRHVTRAYKGKRKSYIVTADMAVSAPESELLIIKNYKIITNYKKSFYLTFHLLEFSFNTSVFDYG